MDDTPSNTNAARIIVFEHPVVAQDCVDALVNLGFLVSYMPIKENVMRIMTDRPDYVFTINFNQYVSEACELLKIPYLAWVIDTPCYSVYDKAINNSCSFTFMYDVAVAQRLRDQGVKQVYHLPVAANLARINQVLQHEDDTSLANDIVLVGNLTKTEYHSFIMPKLTTATLASCNSLIESLNTPSDTFELAEQISEDLIASIRQESGYHLVGDHHLTTAEKLPYLLGREHSWRERIELIHTLEQRLPIRVYGNNEWQTFAKGYAGYADHYSLMPKIFKHAKININLARSFVEYGLPLRVFDVISCGGFLLTNEKQDLHQLFSNGKDLVIFRDTQDLMEICEYYLEHDAERQAVAAHGLATLMENHTYHHRMIDMFTTVQNHLRGLPTTLSRWYI